MPLAGLASRAPGAGAGGRGGHHRQLAVVAAREHEQRERGADQAEEHVPLGVPGVALGAEERLRGLPVEERAPPLDELVAGRERQAHRGRQHREPAAASEGRAAHQHLADEDGGDKALDEVAEPVVVVAGEMERVAEPEAERDLGVGVVPAHREHQRVEEEQAVEHRGEREARRRCDQDRQRHHYRRDLEQPRQSVAGIETRERQQHQTPQHEDERLPTAWHRWPPL